MKRVLIVDDERNLRETLSEILAHEGCQTSTAASGEDAIDLCRSEKFDVVVLDARMPGISGVETAREIRKGATDIRLILMSAYSMDELRREALDEGAVAFVTKPLDIAGLIELVQSGDDPRDQASDGARASE